MVTFSLINRRHHIIIVVRFEPYFYSNINELSASVRPQAELDVCWDGARTDKVRTSGR